MCFLLICMVCEFSVLFLDGIEQFIMVIMQIHYKTVWNTRSTWQSVTGKAKEIEGVAFSRLLF